MVDWNEFRRELIPTLRVTALDRYFDWNGKKKVCDDKFEDVMAAKQGIIV
jgi:hypothetical protein